MTFATDPRVVGSVTGAVPVETVHKDRQVSIEVQSVLFSSLSWIKARVLDKNRLVSVKNDETVTQTDWTGSEQDKT